MPILARTTCIFIALGMAFFISYGAFFQNGPGQVAASMAPFWGKFVWTDVTATFVLFATIIFTFERNWLIGVAMLILMNLLGAAAIAIWLIWRGPELYRRIRPSTNTGDNSPVRSTLE